MSVPKPFEMVLNKKTIKISYERYGLDWTVLVAGKPFCHVARRKQNEWEARANRQNFFLGRTAQQAVMDCVREEYRPA